MQSNNSGNGAATGRERETAPIERPLERVLTPLETFANSQATTGIALLLAVVLALLMANSDYRELYESLNHLPFTVSLGDWGISMSLHHWVNEGLMALFFFVLGLEIKRECLAGDLSDIRSSVLVLFMSAGGMIVPAAIYALLTWTGPEGAIAGWGIPMATDTAFAIGILSLLGARAPRGAVLLLSAVAIVDDLGAVLVITLFYSADIDTTQLLYAALVFAFMWLLNLGGVRRPLPYIAAAMLLWWYILQSGVHTTTAGILAALTVPARPYAGTGWFRRRMRRILGKIEHADSASDGILDDQRQHELVESAREAAIKATTPLQRWESTLDKPVSLVVLPLFAFLNSGVVLPGEASSLVESRVVIAIAMGLALGKVLGVSVFSWLGLRTGWCRLPEGIAFGHLMGLGMLAGIGFTMSLFISALAFSENAALLQQAKLGILAGSCVAGILGAAIFLSMAARERHQD